MVSLAAKRRVVGHLLEKGFSRRFCCKPVRLSRGASRTGRQERRPELRERVVKLSEEHPRFGFRRIHACLVDEGYRVNKKAVHRIWREEGLSLLSRKRKRISVESKGQEPIVAFGEVWSIDFASEWLENTCGVPTQFEPRYSSLSRTRELRSTIAERSRFLGLGSAGVHESRRRRESDR